MPVRLVTAFPLATVLITGSAVANPLAAELRLCREVGSDTERLACYDALASPVELAINGKGSAVTEFFKVADPRLLRFRSSDVIMVVYLLNEAGDVVQNLHRGGAGEGRHLIENPGTYQVQVNATGEWSLRLEVPGK